MNRAEHLQWCKNRANEYVKQGDLNSAFASFTSDMSKHNDTSKHMAISLGIMLLANGHLSTTHQMKEWIDGFN